MVEDSQRIEAAHRVAKRDEHAAVAVGRKRKAAVGDRQTCRPRRLPECVRPCYRDVADVRERGRDPPGTETGIESPVADIDPSRCRSDAECAREQAIRGRKRKAEALGVAHANDATTGTLPAEPRCRPRVIIMSLILGWQFTVGEFVGGPLMIVLLAVLFRLFLSQRLVGEAREQADRGIRSAKGLVIGRV
jgi:hypothetical protein